MKTLLFVLNFVIRIIDNKIIPLCIYVHEYSHYWVAKLLGLKIEKLVLFEYLEDNKVQGCVGVSNEYDENGNVSDSFLFRFMLVAIAPLIPFFGVVWMIFKVIALAAYFYKVAIVYYLCITVYYFLISLIFFGIRVGRSDMVQFFNILGYFLGFVKRDENFYKIVENA